MKMRKYHTKTVRIWHSENKMKSDTRKVHVNVEKEGCEFVDIDNKKRLIFFELCKETLVPWRGVRLPLLPINSNHDIFMDEKLRPKLNTTW